MIVTTLPEDSMWQYWMVTGALQTLVCAVSMFDVGPLTTDTPLLRLSSPSSDFGQKNILITSG